MIKYNKYHFCYYLNTNNAFIIIMSLTTFFEIFGGVGAVVIGVGGCIWNCLRSYEFKTNYVEDDEDIPINVLNETWENIKVENPTYDANGEFFGMQSTQTSFHNIHQLAKKTDGKWRVNIQKNRGNVYIYRTFDKEPEWEYNNKFHYLRLKVKNVPKINEKEFNLSDIDGPCKSIVSLQHKYFDNNWKSVKKEKIKKIKHDDVCIFETKSLIADENIKYEQLGLYIDSKYCEIKDLEIEEAYYGEKWSFWKIFCCKHYMTTILYRKKANKNE